MNGLDLIAIAAYLILTATVGILLGFFVKNVKDFFAGGKSVPWHLGAVSNYMTMMSTFIFVAFAGQAYQYGLVAIVILWCPIPATFFATWFMAHRWQRAGIVTPVEYLEQRYNISVRQFLSWGGVLFHFLDNMVRLYALGVFISAIVGWPVNRAIYLAGGVVIFYTLFGGLWSVVVTDAVQCAILLMITGVMMPLVLHATGGFASLVQALPDHLHFLNGPKGNFWFIAAYYLIVLIKYNGNWAFIQRFYVTGNEREAKKLGYLSIVLYFVFPILFMFPAIAAAAPSLVPGLANPEQAYVEVCKKLLPHGALGLMVAAMFAATMSTLSAEFNVTAGVLTHDIYQRLFRPRAGNREQMVTARVMTVFTGFIIAVGATQIFRFGGAFEANKTLTALFGVPLVIPLVFGMLFRRPQAWGAWASVFTGIATGVVLLFFPVKWELAATLQVAVSIGTLLLSGVRGPRDPATQARVDVFFKKLKTPLPDSAMPPVAGGDRMRLVFVISLGLCGVLFIAISLANFHDPGEPYVCAAGSICFAVATLWGLMMYWKKHRTRKSRE